MRKRDSFLVNKSEIAVVPAICLFHDSRVPTLSSVLCPRHILTIFSFFHYLSEKGFVIWNDVAAISGENGFVFWNDVASMSSENGFVFWNDVASMSRENGLVFWNDVASMSRENGLVFWNDVASISGENGFVIWNDVASVSLGFCSSTLFGVFPSDQAWSLWRSSICCCWPKPAATTDVRCWWSSGSADGDPSGGGLFCGGGLYDGVMRLMPFRPSVMILSQRQLTSGAASHHRATPQSTHFEYRRRHHLATVATGRP